MSNFKIQESEKKRILGMHKSLLKEQATEQTSVKDQLQKFIDDGCFPNGGPIVVKMKSTNPNKEYAIKIQSTKTPNKFRYFFIDNSVGQMENNAFIFLQTPWVCSQSAKDNKILGDAVLKEKKDKEGWMEYSELTGKGYSQLEADQGKYATEQFKTKTGQVITLYKPKTGAVMGGQQEGMSAEQKAFITRYEAKGGKLKLTPEEQASQRFRQISVPGSMAKDQGPFGDAGLKMYFAVDIIPSILGDSSELTTTVESQKITLDECKKFVDQFFEGYQDDTDIPDFELIKRKVQRCKVLYSPNTRTGRKNGWGMLSNQKNKIDVLSGLVTGEGPSSYGDDAKWRLK
jgi:hypothetical protein